MKSLIVKRSIVVRGLKTSVSLEEKFWLELKGIAASRQQSISKLMDDIDAHRDQGNFSSAIRLFILDNALRRAKQLAA